MLDRSVLLRTLPSLPLFQALPVRVQREQALPHRQTCPHVPSRRVLYELGHGD